MPMIALLVGFIVLIRPDNSRSTTQSTAVPAGCQYLSAQLLKIAANQRPMKGGDEKDAGMEGKFMLYQTESLT